MDRPFQDVRPLGPFVVSESADSPEDAEHFDTDIRYDILFDSMYDEEREDEIAEIMEDAVSTRVEDDSYLILVERAGLQTAGIILFSRPIGAGMMSQIHQDISDELRDMEDINTAQPPFIQSG